MQLKILVVEDDHLLALNLKENLEELGYDHVFTAHKADNALSIVEDCKIDLAIVDINLEGSRLDGVELVHRLRPIMDCPVIFLTSYNDEATRERAKAVHPAAYLIKPTTKEQLAITIDLAVENHYQYQQYLSKGMQRNRNEVIYVKSGPRYQKLNVDDVLYLKADGTYCEVFTSYSKHVLSVSLRKVMTEFGESRFIRTHKSYAVQKDRVDSFDHTSVYVQQEKSLVSIPISRTQKEEVFGRLRRMKN